MTKEMRQILAERIYREQHPFEEEPECIERDITLESIDELMDELAEHIAVSQELLEIIAEMVEVLHESKEDPEVIVYCCECPCCTELQKN